ncbi:hypothetical protein CH92_02255 [Stutzerimonas stutzeri]|uniref:DUF484 domain-containing protein n=1 Tax=Stutzerimonas stutzeri TaxID=316 RepID=W8R6P5_STUST|nr:DUF484 family protein [Stutzerimonas stutzeri]AHL73982.1 hypothetical protein CH92_02255 [Stutzerimonas stutzeri]MCQ4328496.1 DUF484 family protein [Stutzerimonas stutzeri]
MTEQNQDKPHVPDAEAVAAYLRAHPEFFVDHDELIPELRIPHLPGGAVSLVERQVKLLRERNIEMRHRLSQLMDVARDNDRLFDKTRRLVLDLLDANSLEEIIGAVDESLRHEFQVPYVSLILFSDSPLPVGRSVAAAEAQQAIGGLLGTGKTVCGVLRPHELAFLFGEEESSGIGSAAVVALNQQQGILAIGSQDPQHYKSSLGTLFLGYIAEVLTRVLPHYSTPLRSVR